MKAIRGSLGGSVMGQLHQHKLRIVLFFASNINETKFTKRKTKITLDNDQQWACSFVEMNLAELTRTVRLC
jgi:hypothetical protein